jgi:hypothetical protein
MKSLTKEQLQKRVNELESIKEKSNERDEKIRKEFATAFGWMNKNLYIHEGEPRDCTWSEIFVEIGKLLYVRGLDDERRRIYDMETRLTHMQENIEKLTIKQQEQIK